MSRCVYVSTCMDKFSSNQHIIKTAKMCYRTLRGQPPKCDYGMRMCMYLRMNGIASRRRLKKGIIVIKMSRIRKDGKYLGFWQPSIDNNLAGEPNKNVIESRLLEELKVGKRFILNRSNGLILKWWWAYQWNSNNITDGVWKWHIQYNLKLCSCISF